MSNKIRKKVKTVVRHDFDDSVKHVVEKVNAFISKVDTTMREMIEKHNTIAARHDAVEKTLSKVMAYTAGTLGQYEGRQGAVNAQFDQAIQGMDRNILAMAEILREVFGQMTQIDTFLKRLSAAGKVSLELDDAEVEVIKTEATSWYQGIVSQAFDTIQKRFAAEEQAAAARAEAEKVAKEMAEKAAKDQDEMARMQKGLSEAAQSDRAVVAGSGGPGADIPEGAEIFGGP